MSSGSVFSGTLQTITSTKLEELLKQRTAFNKQHEALLSAAKAEKDPLKRLNGVADGTKLCLRVKTATHKDGGDRPGQVISGGTRNGRLETDLKNLDRFLDQARFDPSVSPDVLQELEDKLLRYVTIQSTKYQYADLYAKLVSEWLTSEKKVETGPADGDVETNDSFEELPSAKRLEARREWEKSVFEPAAVDLPALKAYLERLFVTDKKDVASAIMEVREKVADFEISLASRMQFTPHTMRWVVESLQGSDFLSNDKREVLNDFLSNEVILAEIADVLNMRMEAFDRWGWGDFVLLEQRRSINGQFHIHMHEDILQAIFLHYIGVKWSVFFKSTFLAVRNNSKVWQRNSPDVPKSNKLRRGYFLGHQGQGVREDLDTKRSKIQRSRYFTNQLLDYVGQQVQHNEGEEEADYADFVEERPRKKAKRRAPQTECKEESEESDDGAACRFLRDVDSSDSESDEDDRVEKNPMEAKQELLHILATEIVLNTRLNGEAACFRTTFKSWNPMLPHDTVLTVLDFFGVSGKWRKFFRTFLEAPLRFAEDDETTEPRLRRRGVPDSHSLSDVFGEVVLFCMDFAVNQGCNGALLHRLYDDVWFWNKDYETCATAWARIREFSKITGTQIDLVKSGSIRVGQDGELGIDDRLPQGDIRWGFLYLNPFNGRFDIDRKMVDSHVSELRKQLQGNSKSVIDWIQTWNSYAATFFSANFGKAANCFGQDHIDTMLATHRHIQESIFDGGNVVQHLKQMIKDRFGVSDLPDGFLFFPVELGGLDLKSPFVGLLQIRDSVKANPYDLLDEYEEKEKDDYADAKSRFDKGKLDPTRRHTEQPDFHPDDADVFFSFEEFTQYREVFASMGKANLRNVYLKLLKRPSEQPVDPSNQVKQALQELRQSNLRGILSSWYSMDAYWKWIAQMYGPDMIARFGGFNIVDPGWLPIGMVSQFRQRRTKWQG
ncbi:hypothetical protein N0V86_003996 [Didymella sp. IMI 355093]|nr:hypothetical protein N0V86_003996 [Didymella sp. IMI 355093]